MPSPHFKYYFNVFASKHLHRLYLRVYDIAISQINLSLFRNELINEKPGVQRIDFIMLIMSPSNFDKY